MMIGLKSCGPACFLAAMVLVPAAFAAKAPSVPVRNAAKPPPSAKSTVRPPTVKSDAGAKTADQPQKIGYADGVTGWRDLVYATLSGFRPLTLDLYQPRRGPKDFPKPALIFVHGGGWSDGDARHGGGFDDFPAQLALLAAQNYVVASVNYRLSGEAHFPAAEQDVKSAIRWLRLHADDYGIDTTRIAIWGEEAGGQLAALAGTSCGVAALEPAASGNQNDPSDCVQAVIDWHGISDLATLAADSGQTGPGPETTFLGCDPASCPPGLVRTASPVAYVGPNSPPFLIQHGPRKNVPLVQSQKLFDALNQAHIPVEQATYADTDSDVAKKSIDKILEFLGKTFPHAIAGKPSQQRPKSGPLPY
jgi:acetyl esterase/lipase